MRPVSLSGLKLFDSRRRMTSLIQEALSSSPTSRFLTVGLDSRNRARPETSIVRTLCPCSSSTRYSSGNSAFFPDNMDMPTILKSPSGSSHFSESFSQRFSCTRSTRTYDSLSQASAIITRTTSGHLPASSRLELPGGEVDGGKKNQARTVRKISVNLDMLVMDKPRLGTRDAEAEPARVTSSREHADEALNWDDGVRITAPLEANALPEPSHADAHSVLLEAEIPQPPPQSDASVPFSPRLKREALPRQKRRSPSSSATTTESAERSAAGTQEGEVSLGVPRSKQLKDGQWRQADTTAVKQAMDAAANLAPKVAATPSTEKGNHVLIGRTEEELEELVVELGEQKYRGRQLHQFLYKNKGMDFNDLPLLPQKFRDDLTARGFSVGRVPVHHVAAASDGTAKLLMRLDDNRLVEAVGIPTEVERGVHRLTACISSQVGCPLRCTFCATGKGGFARNLRPHEIVSQVLSVQELFNHRVTNVVFMGMGEPLLNLPAVLAAHRCLNKALGIGQRAITISTVGVPNTIRKLAQSRLQSTLAISLHAPTQLLREQIVPSAKVYPLDALMEDCRAYFELTGRRVSFEYTLLAGVNDQPSHALQLAALLRQWDMGHHVNVIPFNPISDSEFQRPTRAAINAFLDALKSRRVTATVRVTRGLEANAACGQLRNDFQKFPLESAGTAPMVDAEADSKLEPVMG
eukprot:TRINITY_DN5095_c0_g2_i1.p1 TRINITY_DN5095_c0_g2~~TRINITY_DN5095_c0_g2_i1.p1  ORF type:complete len:694 (+),score=91.22 TRINITY_DN5095_c0_g2_i1:160-2241(+)